MIVELILTALLLGWGLRGKITRLADARLKYAWMIFVPLGLSVSTSLLDCYNAIPFSSPIFSFARVLGLVTWCVFVVGNMRLPGAKLILAGLLLNVLAVVANGGIMPVSYDGIIVAYGKQGAAHWMKVFPCVNKMLIGPHTRLWVLCDIFPIPRPFSMGFVYSIGDIITSVGGLIAIVALMRRPSPAEPQQAKGAA